MGWNINIPFFTQLSEECKKYSVYIMQKKKSFTSSSQKARVTFSPIQIN